MCLQGASGEVAASGVRALPIGPQVVPFCGSYLESYKGIPKKGTT